ncbi:MAG: pilus assembly protein [Oceanospirillales bacterium]|uniref:Pilus assembly protein Flp/PilA n=1 Tax=Marinobacterium halophilum TaxID=267374 RepID=A0A2P8F1B7_9GAMM|nr:pilus assembly protein [Marinobacterium halophilum]MBR9829112.1 pilus assembly protein [Oceanospirillales bacterium]PSL15511.1 pilus assembly protein Flp/PilA [Marinobacterium halophilum]
MNVMTQKFVDFIKEEEGLTTVEYAIAGSLVAAAVIVAFTDLGCEVGEVIAALATTLDTGADAAQADAC